MGNKKADDTKRVISAFIDKELYIEIQEIAKEDDRSASYAMERLLRAAISERKRQAAKRAKKNQGDPQ